MSDSLKKIWGDEYPAAVILHGVRAELWKETRFMRRYKTKENRMGASIPRFLDGSASISMEELKRIWPTWSDEERDDFCSAAGHIPAQADKPDILRFIMQSDDPDHWSAIAMSLGVNLPKDEAFAILVAKLGITHPSANITQAIAITKHRDAAVELRKHFEHIWKTPDLWEDASFQNWTAFDAICCIQHLIEVGIKPSEFDDYVQKLSKHQCRRTRETCSDYLGKHYDWLA